MKNNDSVPGKRLDLEMLIFFFIIVIISFLFYLLKHPITANWIDQAINRRALNQIYLFDLLLLAALLICYLIVLFISILYLIIYRKELNDDLFLILFFPLFGFFAKSMMLPQIYTDYQIINIIKDNLVFFVFLALGPMILVVQYIVKRIFKIKIN